MSRFKKGLESIWCDKILIVCIGNSSITGDSLGPLVGTKLKEDKEFCVPVIGTLESNIGASKLDYVRKLIELKYSDYYVIGIDATISDIYSAGTHHFRNLPMNPGAGLYKNLGLVGNGSIKGIVLESEDLSNVTKLKQNLVQVDQGLIDRMATRIVRDIKSVYLKYIEEESKLCI